MIPSPTQLLQFASMCARFEESVLDFAEKNNVSMRLLYKMVIHGFTQHLKEMPDEII